MNMVRLNYGLLIIFLSVSLIESSQQHSVVPSHSLTKLISYWNDCETCAIDDKYQNACRSYAHALIHLHDNDVPEQTKYRAAFGFLFALLPREIVRNHIAPFFSDIIKIPLTLSNSPKEDWKGLCFTLFKNKLHIQTFDQATEIKKLKKYTGLGLTQSEVKFLHDSTVLFKNLAQDNELIFRHSFTDHESNITIFDESGDAIFAHEDDAIAPYFWTNGVLAAIINYKGNVKLFDIKSGKLIKQFCVRSNSTDNLKFIFFDDQFSRISLHEIIIDKPAQLDRFLADALNKPDPENIKTYQPVREADITETNPFITFSSPKFYKKTTKRAFTKIIESKHLSLSINKPKVKCWANRCYENVCTPSFTIFYTCLASYLLAFTLTHLLIRNFEND